MSPWCVLGRWLLYTLAGFLLLSMMLAGGGDSFGADDPKGRWRSILLSFAGLLAALAGGGVYYGHRQGGSLGDYWPAAAVAAWVVAGGFVIAAWLSIASDLRREPARRRRQ